MAGSGAAGMDRSRHKQASRAAGYGDGLRHGVSFSQLAGQSMQQVGDECRNGRANDAFLTVGSRNR